MKSMVVTPWVHEKELMMFLKQWGIDNSIPDWLILQHDEKKEGCGVTKNKGIARAIELGADMVVILDGDCYPSDEIQTLSKLIEKHAIALEPQEVELFEIITDPPSRGTPYIKRTMTFPVAASMGFWTEIGDHCAVRQLAFGAGPMEYQRKTIFGRYFPLCGMNLAFKPHEWLPWCQFIEVPRFDDIWMGWLWQREAYQRGFCFNLNGPLIYHSRQSNVWRNLREESIYLETNETLWQKIAMNEINDYDHLRGLLPC